MGQVIPYPRVEGDCVSLRVGRQAVWWWGIQQDGECFSAGLTVDAEDCVGRETGCDALVVDAQLRDVEITW